MPFLYILSTINPTKNMSFYKGKYRQKTRRNYTHDYASNCWYMVTINTLNRKNYFGPIVTTNNCLSLQCTHIGDFAMKCWKEIPKHYPQVSLDEFVIMPKGEEYNEC